MVEQEHRVSTLMARTSVAETSPRFKLAASVAQFAELLRHSYWAKGKTLDDVVELAREAERRHPGDADIAEFVALLVKATDLAPTSPRPAPTAVPRR